MILKSSTVLTVMLTACVWLTGCQQPSAPVIENDSSEPQSVEDDKSAIQSESAKARIAQFQPLYVAEMQRLQQRLQAEYDAFEAADVAVDDNSLLATELPNTISTDAVGTAVTDNVDQPAIPLALDAEVADLEATADTPINTSTEVGERDLEVLKRISLEPQKPRILTESETIKRYQQAIKALYQPMAIELDAQDIDTLINISTLLPELFEHEEIAERVSVKSPALARLIVQYQVGKQIEAQQVLDMQQMKLTQQQEFDGLMAKFNETIEGYDEQIAKYEQTLKEFQ